MQDLDLGRGSMSAFKGSVSPSHPCPILRTAFPPPFRGEIQIYRWGHFTGQLRPETGNKKGRLFVASRTSVVRAFWKARLFLAVCLQSRGGGGRRHRRRQSLGCPRRFANHSWIPTFLFDCKEGFGATWSNSQPAEALHTGTQNCAP